MMEFWVECASKKCWFTRPNDAISCSGNNFFTDGEALQKDGVRNPMGYQVTYSVPYALISAKIESLGVSQGLSMGVLNLAVVMPQMNAGAVMLTYCVFWFILAPFLTTKNFKFNFFIINMHTINLFFMLGDTALNIMDDSYLDSYISTVGLDFVSFSLCREDDSYFFFILYTSKE